MDPIISPLFIYVLSLVSSVFGLCIAYLVITGIMWFILGMVGMCEMYGKEEVVSVIKRYKLKGMSIIAGFATLIIVFVPSKNTIIAMYVADKITYGNVEKTIDAGKTIKDSLKKDVLDIIQAIQDKQETSK